MRNLLLLFILFTATIVSGQYNKSAPWMVALEKKQSATVSKNGNDSFTIYEISDSFEAYWKDKDPDKKGSGYKPFMRWKNYWEQMANADGSLPSPAEYWQSFKNKQNNAGKPVNPTSDWSSIGPFEHGRFSGALPGQGRVNAVAVDPNDPNTWYVGAPAGGIWKSTNAGTTWATLFDDFPQIGVSGIAIDPNNSDIVYIATGDDDAADSFSVGVFKSLDGGATWNETGLNPSSGGTGFLMNEITIDPTNSNVIWVGTNAGLQKSVDGGDTWEVKQNGNISDFKLKPGNSQVIYAVDTNSYYVSVNGGDSFTEVTTNLPTNSGRLALAVTPANPNMVYLLSADRGANDFAFQGLFKSTDSGQSFTETANTVNIFESNQAWFDLAIEVSPTNANEVYIGCLNIWKSTNGGDDFTQLNQWFDATPSYTHADIHTLKFFNGNLFCGSDGGVYVSEDNGTTFTDYTAGIAISQFYRLSVAKSDSGKMAGGLQDNSGFVRNNGSWNVYTGGDGMDYEIDPTNSSLVYGFSQFGGNLWVSTNSGQSIGRVFPPTDGDNNSIRGNWITPLAINSEGEVFSGFDGLYKLEGNSWTKLSGVGSGPLDDVEIDQTNSDNIYVAENATLFRSTNGGTTFTILNEFDSNISDIALNSTDPNVLYVTTSNRVGTSQSGQPNQRGVFKLTINGSNATEEEITLNLPTDQAFLSIAHQGRDATNPIFVGTNLGVYRLDDTLTEWEDYFTGFPNTAVGDLEISVDDAIITAATYGRGIWQSPIPVQAPDNDARLLSVTPGNSAVFCDDVVPEIVVENKGANSITSVDVTYDVNGGSSESFNWTGTIPVGGQETIPFPSFLTGFVGIVALNVSISITDDAYSDNNSLSTDFILNESTPQNTLFTFESESEALFAFNEGGTGSVWERGVPTGTLLNTASSGTQVMGTVLDGNHPDQTKGFLLSKCYDLSNLLAPKLSFDMAYDLEENWDVVYVEYSTNGGTAWEVLGSIDSQPNWYNSDRTNAISGEADDCQNCPGAQWTGTNATMTEYTYDFVANAALGEVDLTTETNILFRIVFQSDPAVTQEGAIVDDFIVSGFIDDEDDDNDGVLDVDDNCPLVANADQTNTDGDDEGDSCDMDDDNDGILDLDDNCPLTPNADQADFDGDGIGDVCDDDIDNDGVPNAQDTCPETPVGAVIDVTGCAIFSLPANNFRILTNGESCISSNNGSIIVEVVEALNYTATLTGTGTPIENTFTDTTTFADLEAGSYQVCITVDGEAGYENCFDLIISEPEPLSVASKVSSLKGEVTFDLSGGDRYFITLNNEVFTTTEKQITLPLNQVENAVSIKTDKDCQGVYKETIVLSNELFIYPNPIESGNLTVFLGNTSSKEATLSLYSINGATVFTKPFAINAGTVQFNVDVLSKGIYILNVKTDKTLLTQKIVRK